MQYIVYCGSVCRSNQSPMTRLGGCRILPNITALRLVALPSILVGVNILQFMADDFHSTRNYLFHQIKNYVDFDSVNNIVAIFCI